MSRVPWNDTLCRRLFTQVRIDGVTGCWIFTGNLRNGYGRIQNNLRNLSVHRVTWEMWNGPIPEGHEIHHRCGREACCNPEHLEAVTKRRHLTELTPTHIAYRNARRTHCPKGHPLVEGNLQLAVLKEGRRRCLICARESAKMAMRRHVARLREQRV